MDESTNAEKIRKLGNEAGTWAEVREAVQWLNEEGAANLVVELLTEAREALKREQAELVLYLRSRENLAVLTFNTNGLITSVCKNSAELLGQPVENLVGKPVDLILARRSCGVKQSSDEMDRAEGGEQVQAIRAHRRQDGTGFTAEHTVVAVVGRDEKLTGFVREIREVTQRKVHEVRIAELDRVIAFLVEEQAGEHARQR